MPQDIIYNIPVSNKSLHRLQDIHKRSENRVLGDEMRVYLPQDAICRQYGSYNLLFLSPGVEAYTSHRSHRGYLERVQMVGQHSQHTFLKTIAMFCYYPWGY